MLGFIWAYVDSDSLTWHDRMSGTIITEAHTAADIAGLNAETSTHDSSRNVTHYGRTSPWEKEDSSIRSWVRMSAARSGLLKSELAGRTKRKFPIPPTESTNATKKDISPGKTLAEVPQTCFPFKRLVLSLTEPQKRSSRAGSFLSHLCIKQ